MSRSTGKACGTAGGEALGRVVLDDISQRERRPVSAGPDDFDMSAAWLRRAKEDVAAFAEALAARLAAALPDAVDIERRRDGLFSRTSRVAKIEVRTSGGLLTLHVDRSHMRATRAKVVRGVTIGSEDITVPAWLDEILHGTRTLGAEAGHAHEALHSFLTS